MAVSTAQIAAVLRRRNFVGSSAYYANRVVFDGSTYLQKNTAGLTGVTNGQQFTFWCQIEMAAGTDGTDQWLFSADRDIGGNNIIRIARRAGGNLEIMVTDEADNLLIAKTTTPNAVIEGQGVQTIYIAADGSSGSNGFIECRVNGVDLLTSNDWDGTPANIDWARGTNWRIGARATANDVLSAQIADVWFDDSYRPHSSFRSASGAKSLGDNGEKPAGIAPALFFGGSDTAATWNAGGSGFTMVGAATNAGHRMVDFLSTLEYMDRFAPAPFGQDSQAFTFIFHGAMSDPASIDQRICEVITSPTGPSFRLQLRAQDGRLQGFGYNASNSLVINFTTNLGAGLVMLEDVPSTFYGSWRSDTGALRVRHNGASALSITQAQGETVAFSGMGGARIGGRYNNATFYWRGQMGLFVFMSQVAIDFENSENEEKVLAIADPSAVRDPRGYLNAANFGVPDVWFGGQQKADEGADGDPAKGYNDGYNQGTSGNFDTLLSGGIVDA